MALRRIVFEQVGQIVRWDEVVDGDHIQRFAEQTLLDECPKHQPPDATKPIDAHFDCHAIAP